MDRGRATWGRANRRARQTQSHLRPWIIGMGGPTGAREIGPHRGGGGKREKAISQGRGGAGEEIVNAHLSLGLGIIPIVHRNYDGWTIRWSLPARRPPRDHEFESDFLQQGEPCYALAERLALALISALACGCALA